MEILKLNYRRVKVLLVKDTFVTYFVYRRAILVINQIQTTLDYAKRQRKRKDPDRVLFKCVEYMIYQFGSKLESLQRPQRFLRLCCNRVNLAIYCVIHNVRSLVLHFHPCIILIA